MFIYYPHHHQEQIINGEWWHCEVIVVQGWPIVRIFHCREVQITEEYSTEQCVGSYCEPERIEGQMCF